MSLEQNLDDCDRKAINSLKSFDPLAINMMIFLDYQELEHLDRIDSLMKKIDWQPEYYEELQDLLKYIDILKFDINNHVKCLNIAEYEILEEMRKNDSSSK